MDLVEKLFATTDLYKILNISADKAGDEKARKKKISFTLFLIRVFLVKIVNININYRIMLHN